MIHYGTDERTQFWEAGNFALESGTVLPSVTVAYRTWGRLNEAANNAVLVCHALTGDANVDGWWGEAIGPGAGIDTDRYFVVASNVLGGCYGTTGPTSVDPATGDRYGPDFPDLTIRDMVRLQRALVARLGIRRLVTVVGGSMGGMQVLEWAAGYPDIVDTAIPISIGADHSPWCIGVSEVQRNAVAADPKWRDGRYDPAEPPTAGLALARQIAIISYRSPDSFDAKFGRRATDGGYDVSSYLEYQGSVLVDRFDANTYMTLTRAMDTHDVGRDRGGIAAALGRLTMPVLVIGISSDVLYPVAEQRRLAKLVPNAKYVELDVPHGHDGFLIEHQAVGTEVQRFLAARRQSTSFAPKPAA
jgi:homoserine O-acetyltransferase